MLIVRFAAINSNTVSWKVCHQSVAQPLMQRGPKRATIVFKNGKGSSGEEHGEEHDGQGWFVDGRVWILAT